MMTLSYPITCDDTAKRLKYVYMAQEKLRLLHNQVGKWHREGSLPEDEYNALPDEFKATLPKDCSKPLSVIEWQKFLEYQFHPRQTKVSIALQGVHAELRMSTCNITIADIDK
jgi:hypothetical protein